MFTNLSPLKTRNKARQNRVLGHQIYSTILSTGAMMPSRDRHCSTTMRPLCSTTPSLLPSIRSLGLTHKPVPSYRCITIIHPMPWEPCCPLVHSQTMLAMPKRQAPQTLMSHPSCMILAQEAMSLLTSLPIFTRRSPLPCVIHYMTARQQLVPLDLVHPLISHLP